MAEISEGRLVGRVAVITGGGSGIGRETAQLFASHGASVALIDVDAAGARETEQLVADAGGVALALEADVSDDVAAADAVEEIADRFGTIDVLMTAAGISVGRTVVDTDPGDWDRVFAVNVRGSYVWMRATLPTMVAQQRGSVILVASQLALGGGRSNAAYISSKGAIVALARTTALDHATDGVRINSLLPGATETPLLDRSFARLDDAEGARARSLARHPMGRFGRASEIANAALFLASDESSFTTGTELKVDGGWLAG